MDGIPIFGDARRAAENADRVEYAIFPDDVAGSSGNLRQNCQVLEEQKAACMALIQEHTEGYIWQKDVFSLIVVGAPDLTFGWKVEEDGQTGETTSEITVPPHLYGSSRFGDNIDDECFIVFLLMTISRRLRNVSVAVRDADGYFLLIEAAYALPKWLEPDTSLNRVFIRGGALHIVPPPATAKKRRDLPPISLPDALAAVRDPAVQTLASGAIQSAIQRPLAGYPERARSNQHRAHCLLPLPIAHILRHEPQLVGPAVESFYDRDVDSMKAAARMEFVLPAGAQTPMVKTAVQFSRAMYAQLRQQEFQAPKVYPPLLPSQHPDFPSAELGMKLAVGFEMLYADRARYGETAAEGEEEAPQSRLPLQDDPGWQAFKHSLESRGYFKDLLEGSAEYQRLLVAAAAEYRSTRVAARVGEQQYGVAKRMEDVLKMPATEADFPESALPPEDSDTWLYDGEADLTRAVREREQEMERDGQELTKPSAESPDKTKADAENPGFDTDRVVDSMKRFVEGLSSFEGAEVPREGGGGEEVHVDMVKFMTELEAALGIGGGEEENDADGLDSDLDSDMEWDEGDDSEGESIGERGLEVAGASARMRDARAVEADEGASDSDDSFMDEYGEAMDQQLSSSTLPKSFVRPSEAVQTEARAKDADAAPSGKVEQRPGEQEGDEPLNVDVNLMKNLLDSYSAQQGLPGPASNLLGMLGLSLPDDEKQARGQAISAQGSKESVDDLEEPD